MELSTEHFEVSDLSAKSAAIPLRNPEFWQPRWYYVMRNKTSGKLYAGQTVAENMDWYCGSGGYWTGHCNKHGGKTRDNVEVVEQTWFTEEWQAREWLDRLESAVPDYWRGNPQWANRILESTESSPFAGEAGSKFQRDRIENGTHNWAGEAGSKLQRELNLQRVENGTHNWAGEAGSKRASELAMQRVENGTHPFAGEAGSKRASELNLQRVENGTHHFLDSELHAKRNRVMASKGIHPNQQKTRLKAFYQAATGKTANANKIYKGCPEELELQTLGYDTQAIRYGTLKWPEAA
jgi:hypothetical protein